VAASATGAAKSATRASAAPPGAATSTTVLEADDPRGAWEKESHHYDVLHRRLRTIVDLAEAAGGRRLLDVGCSAGTIGAALAPTWAYHGCDVSESAVRSAARGWLVAADLERGIPAFDGGAYDVIVCSGILEYLDVPEKTLREIAARIAPNGKLIVSYFNMRHVSRRGGNAFRHPLWRNHFTPAEFRGLLQDSGWTIEATRWSTAGLGSAPDVRDEAAAVRDEPRDAAQRIDEIGHTLIYVCSVAPARAR
jgi:SAM-dependent methyltransferase